MTSNIEPISTMPHPRCEHKHTRVVAEDNEAKYIECLDCGEILEVGELKETAGFDESLSDA